jgi:hypothetical protein
VWAASDEFANKRFDPFPFFSFDTKLAFDPLGESDTANRNGFQPWFTFREFLNFEGPRFVFANDLN